MADFVFKKCVMICRSCDKRIGFYAVWKDGAAFKFVGYDFDEPVYWDTAGNLPDWEDIFDSMIEHTNMAGEKIYIEDYRIERRFIQYAVQKAPELVAFRDVDSRKAKFRLKRLMGAETEAGALATILTGSSPFKMAVAKVFLKGY